MGVAPVAAAPLSPSPPPRAQRPNRCLPDGPPKARPPAKLHEAATCVDHRRAEAALARKIIKAYDRTVKGSVVEVSFGCDPLVSDLEEIVVESGYGHGGNLELWRLTRNKEDTDYNALGLGLVGYFRSSAEGGSPVRLFRGRISERALTPALSLARPALTLNVRELEPPPLPNGLWGRSFSTSSGNFHHFLRMTDGQHRLTRHYTGYPNSGGQPRYLGVQAAMAALHPLLEKVALDTKPITADERDFFVRSFLAAARRFEDEYAWWVRERYVTLAEHLGTPELVPALVEVIENALAEADREKDEAQKKTTLERRLEHPLAAVARITGWDPRKDDAGVARSPAAAAREVITECGGARGRFSDR